MTIDKITFYPYKDDGYPYRDYSKNNHTREMMLLN